MAGGAEDRNLLAVVQLAQESDSGTFAPAKQWQAIGTLNSSALSRQNVGWDATGRGCNRIRVHQPSQRAIFSCFGGGHGHASVGFVDLSSPAAPRLMARPCTRPGVPVSTLLYGQKGY